MNLCPNRISTDSELLPSDTLTEKKNFSAAAAAHLSFAGSSAATAGGTQVSDWLGDASVGFGIAT